jgi:uncharacterized LabA/DUF88 family protein
VSLAMLQGMIGGNMPNAEYVYIDGAYLRSRLEHYSKRYCGGIPLRLDFHSFFQQFEKKYYYDCLPLKTDNESDDVFKSRSAEVQALFEELQRLPGFHVYQGKVAGEGGRARQKGVDVQLATHMLTHAFRGITRRATLVAGDADFTPLAEAVGAEGRYVTLWSHPKNTARDLIHSVDIYQPFEPQVFFDRSKKDFKQGCPGPQVWEGGLSLEPADVLVKNGRHGNGTVQLYENIGSALLVYSRELYLRHVRWDTKDMVLNYADDLNMTIDWEARESSTGGLGVPA